TGFYETEFDFFTQDFERGLVVDETLKQKKKRILPFLLWAGGSWLALDAVNNGSGTTSRHPSNENGYFTDHDLKCSQRITDAVISQRQLPSRINWNNDLETNLQSGIFAQSKLNDFATGNQVWKNGFLIGRLNPLYVSLSGSGSDKSKILIAGLNNLSDGEIAQVEIYDHFLHYTIQLNKEDGDDLGVFKTEVDLKAANVRMSIQVLR
ncbi:hypothetical protein KKB99_04410, partial [bacterium]|nr:hypothetical protein [bacterium]MBU1025237.1 hypothetical protein [bacterium]